MSQRRNAKEILKNLELNKNKKFNIPTYEIWLKECLGIFRALDAYMRNHFTERMECNHLKEKYSLLF